MAKIDEEIDKEIEKQLRLWWSVEWKKFRETTRAVSGLSGKETWFWENFKGLTDPIPELGQIILDNELYDLNRNP